MTLASFECAVTIYHNGKNNNTQFCFTKFVNAGRSTIVLSFLTKITYYQNLYPNIIYETIASRASILRSHQGWRRTVLDLLRFRPIITVL